MTHAQIAATYSDQALACIIRDLTGKGWKEGWEARLQAAKQEQARRALQNLNEDKESKL